MNITIYGETLQEKKCKLSVFNIVRCHNAKMSAKIPIWSSETTFIDVYLLNVYERFRYKNTRKHGKHHTIGKYSLRTNKKTLPE